MPDQRGAGTNGLTKTKARFRTRNVGDAAVWGMVLPEKTGLSPVGRDAQMTAAAA